jgi:hypothetical protein
MPAGTPAPDGLPLSVQLTDVAVSRLLAELAQAGLEVDPDSRWM